MKPVPEDASLRPLVGRTKHVGSLVIRHETPRRLTLTEEMSPPLKVLVGVAMLVMLASAAWLAFTTPATNPLDNVGGADLVRKGIALVLVVGAGVCLYGLLRSLRVVVTRVHARSTLRLLGIPQHEEVALGLRRPEVTIETRLTNPAGPDTPRRRVYVPVLRSLGGLLDLSSPFRERSRAQAVVLEVERHLSRLFAKPEDRQQELQQKAAWAEPIPVGGEGQCPYCRDPLDVGLVACQGCRTPYHEECALELGRCGTIGCQHNRPRAQV